MDFPLFRESVFYIFQILFFMLAALFKEGAVRFFGQDFIDKDGFYMNMILIEQVDGFFRFQNRQSFRIQYEDKACLIRLEQYFTCFFESILALEQYVIYRVFN